jgi:hypothetical protein
MVGIWCVELGSQENTGRWARRGCLPLEFDTEEDAMAEVRKLRAKHGYFARGRWLFFTSPIGAKIDCRPLTVAALS